MSLKTNYKDDILDTSKNEKRKYKMTSNSDGTISLDDVTVYTQVGDNFGAKDINNTNKTYNASIGNLKLKTLTQSEYESLPTKDNNTLYFTYVG